MEYNTGNYDKYMTSNPLKKKMVNNLNSRIIGIMGKLLSKPEKVYRILDAGCGEGFISNLIFNNFRNVEITGLEYTSEAVRIARSMNNKINYLQGDIYKMPFEDSSFDMVICTEVLEHLESPLDALRELHRVSENEILLTVPEEPWFCLGNLAVLKNVSRLGNPEDHINHWTYRRFVKYVKTCLGGGIYLCSKSFPWTVVLYKKH